MNKHVYVYEALYRKKDNPTKATANNICIREVDWYDEPEETIARLKDKTRRHPGVWRIYRTVNRRDVMKAERELISILVDRQAGVNQTNKRVDSLWKTALLQPRNKAERYFLLDIDSPNAAQMSSIAFHLETNGVEVLINQRSPNGWHLITTPFNQRLIEEGNVEIKKDALLFIERYTVPENSPKGWTKISR